MNSALAYVEDPQLVGTDLLVDVLNAVLCETADTGCRVRRLERRYSDYYSSYVMEEIDVLLENGQRLELTFKNLSRDAMLEGAVKTKPVFLYNPMREIEAYRKVLSAHRLGTPRFYGTFIDRPAEQYWLFIERVPGTLLWQFGDDALWQHVAGWLRRMHTTLLFDAQSRLPAEASPFRVYNADYYWQWMRRAQAFLYRTAERSGHGAVEKIDWLADRFQIVVDRLIRLPVTLIHGEFYPSNVLVKRDANGTRVCPVDWETAAIGPGLIDLSALTSGSWTEAQRLAMAMAYFDGLGTDSDEAARTEFLVDLDFCNLFMAIQWLGWSPDWEPPPEHAQNWLTEADALAKKLHL